MGFISAEMQKTLDVIIDLTLHIAKDTYKLFDRGKEMARQPNLYIGQNL